MVSMLGVTVKSAVSNCFQYGDWCQTCKMSLLIDKPTLYCFTMAEHVNVHYWVCIVNVAFECSFD